jgi:hypothetical protein
MDIAAKFHGKVADHSRYAVHLHIPRESGDGREMRRASPRRLKWVARITAITADRRCLSID